DRVLRAVDARAAAHRDRVGDELGDVKVELLAVRDVCEIGDPAVPECSLTPEGLVTTTSLRLPAGRAGIVAVMCVESGTFTLVAGDPPTVTVAPVSKSIPSSVTFVPPSGGPDGI